MVNQNIVGLVVGFNINYRSLLKYLVLSKLLLFSVFAQEKSKHEYFVFTQDGLPTQGVNITIQYNDKTEHLISDSDGRYMPLKGNILRIILSHIGYKTMTLEPPFSKITHLELESVALQELSIYKKKEELTTHRNFGFETTVVTYFPSTQNDIGRLITFLKYNTINIGDVKGLKYLPFKVNIFTIDTVNGLPHKKLLPDGIIVKRTNERKWINVDIKKYNIHMPKEGIFVVFETLPTSYYKVEWIQADFGIIDAVPVLKIKSREDGKKSFIKEKSTSWMKQKEIYEMDIELEK